MLFHPYWKRVIITALFSNLVFFESFTAVLGQEGPFISPGELLEAHRSEILHLSSDQEALELHKSLLLKSDSKQIFPKRRTQTGKSDKSPQNTTSGHDLIITYWAELTAIAKFQKIHGQIEHPLNPPFLLENLFSEAQKIWLLSQPSLVGLEPLLIFGKKLSQAHLYKPNTFLMDEEYFKFANFHDRTTAKPGEGPSWPHILSEAGLEGVESQLSRYWIENHDPHQDHISDFQKKAFIRQYVALRLIPIFEIYLLGQVLEFEAHVYQAAMKSWNLLEQSQKKQQDEKARKRLCGNWKWIVHNHQNHGDYKTIMTFTAPDLTTPPQMQPTTIAMHGDTLYLKWVFSQSIQEDSLLFSNHDTRLEGTFFNSRGPYGSISGQRLSTCKKEHQSPRH